MRTIAALLCMVCLAPGGEDKMEAVRKVAQSISEKIEQEFGKKFTEPVPVAVMTKAELVAFGRRQIERHLPPELLDAAQRLAVRLRHIPKGYDLVERQLDMLEAGGAGLYDPETNRYYLMEGASNPDTVPFYATAGHELMHAYRDVDKDFWQRTLDAIHHDADWATAVQFMFEGDAQLVGAAVGIGAFTNRPTKEMLATMARRAVPMAVQISGSANLPPMNVFPRVLRESFVAPYAHGIIFAAEIYQARGNEGLTKAFDQPPRSTEQALHPEKYLSDEPDEPMVIYGGDPTKALGPGARRLFSNVMGEFEIRTHLAGALGKKAAIEAAAGWDGCRYHVCELPERATMFGLIRERPLVIGMITTWDTPKDAAQFAAAWAAWGGKRDEGRPHDLVPGENSIRVDTEDGPLHVVIDGLDVIVCDGAPPERMAAVVRALRSSQRIERTADASPRAEIEALKRRGS